MTDAERRLWWHLRHRLPIAGSHFRRQVAIGPYVTDFCCFERRLIIEVDGNQHGTDRNLRRDATRDAFLNERGFCVLRFANHQVMRETDTVLDTVFAALDQTIPHLNPSPPGAAEAEPLHA